MFNAFGNEVAIWRAPVALAARSGRGVLSSPNATIRQLAPLEARGGSLAWTGIGAPLVQQAPIGTATAVPALHFVLLEPIGVSPFPSVIAPPNALHQLTWPPLRSAVRLPAIPPLIAPPRHEPPLPVPVVRDDLAIALKVPVRRRMVPAAKLSPETAAHWLRRLADSRKMARARLELLGLFKDVQLADGGEVRHQAAQDTVTFPLSPTPVPPSTIVLARRTDSGELVVARFY